MPKDSYRLEKGKLLEKLFMVAVKTYDVDSIISLNYHYSCCCTVQAPKPVMIIIIIKWPLECSETDFRMGVMMKQ